jgi:hypothetical protein
MKRWCLAASLLLLAGLAQSATVQVSFDHPERFTDVGDSQNAARVHQVIERHLQALAQAKLPATQTLQVTITDIDLAGEVNLRPGRLQDVRVMRGKADWPRIELRYTLSEGDRTLAQGSERLIDMNYLVRPLPARADEPLPYERRMLDAWFDRRFAAQAPH